MIAGFVRGLSVRDVEAALAEALGPDATVSKSTVSRFCQAIKDEFDVFKKKSLARVELEPTDEVLQRMADETEAGLDITQLRRLPGVHRWVQAVPTRSGYGSTQGCARRSMTGRRPSTRRPPPKLSARPSTATSL